MADRLPWPFLIVADEAGRDLGWAIVQGPLEDDDDAVLASLAPRHRFLGMTGCADFPRWRPPGDDRDYAARYEGWAHCFRDPDAYLPAGVPRLLLGHSDFTDVARVADAAQGGAPGFDFVYVCASDPWSERAKNWPLAARCLPVLCEALGLRGLLVGRTDAPHPGITAVPPLPWHDLMRALGGARVALFPNELDASPRLLTEALAAGTPVVVNRRILGGWKYVNAFTGTFFSDEHDVADAVQRCLAAPTSPAAWFRANHGPWVSGQRLARFLRRLDPALPPMRFVRITDVVRG